jgi:hypothetical protein
MQDWVNWVWSLSLEDWRNIFVSLGVAVPWAWWTARGGWSVAIWTARRIRQKPALLGVGTGHLASDEGKEAEAVSDFCQRLCDALATLTLKKSGPFVLTCGDKIEARLCATGPVEKVLVGAVDVLALLEAESDREALRCAVHDAFARAECERIAREKAEALSLLPDLKLKEKPITGSRDVVDANGLPFRVFFDADGFEVYRKPLAWKAES